MVKLSNLVSYLNKYLEVNSVRDGSWNGLQFEGTENVKKICVAVDSGASVFQAAAESGADLIIVHHGLLWKNNDPSINGIMKKRMEILFKNNISLYVSHLPLDVHSVIGNNIELLKLMKAKKSGVFLEDGGFRSFIGKFEKPVSIKNITSLLCKELKTECKILPFGKDKIKTVGVLTGASNRSCIEEAVALGLDLFVTGEEMDVYQYVQDTGINVIFAGHNATETLGVNALRRHLEKKFTVQTKFIDMPTSL